MTHHTSLRPSNPPQHSALAGSDVIMFSKAIAARSWMQRTLVAAGGGGVGGTVSMPKMNHMAQLTLTC